MFQPNSSLDEQQLLEATGISSFEQLLTGLPKKHVNPGLGLPSEMSEIEVTRHLTDIASRNGLPLSFLGAGSYDHFTSSVVNSLISRGEFATAYTPYQPEASQGTLQTIFEFQSLVAEIYGMEMANASLYDGATAVVEAVLVAIRHTERPVVLVPETLHPHYRRAIETTFAENSSHKMVTISCSAGVIDSKDLSAKLEAHRNEVAALVIQTPNFFGCLEDGIAAAEKIHAVGGLLIASANPLSLGVLAPPGEYNADIAVGEGQPLGLPMSFGGPYVGLFSCKMELMRKTPGRICGQTVDVEGKTAYVLTIQAREQHIRREKANSNICTNQNLCAAAFAVQASMLGPDGLRELAELNLQLAHYTADQLTQIPGFRLTFNAPFFNEFVLELPVPAEPIHKKLLEVGVLAGLPLKAFFPKLDHHLLINVTERKSKADIDRLVSLLRSY